MASPWWKTYPLEHLLPTNILQPAVQILHLLHNILHLVLVFRLNLARFTDSHVQSDLDRTGRGARQPATASCGVGLGGHADLVQAGVGSGEGKASGVAVTLGDNAVVVVEDLVDGDEHLKVRVHIVGVGLLVDHGGGVGTFIIPTSY